MNIYEKLAEARARFKALNIKQSGNNKFAGYTYFELSDILPATTKIEKDLKMVSCVSFGAEQAVMEIVNTEEPRETIIFTSPMSTADLKGCHAVQNLGAVETYIRRYLYLTAYEIVEAETLDATQGKPDEKKQAPTNTDAQNVELTLEQALELTFKRGKYAGKKFSEVDDSMLSWMAKNATGVYQEGAKMVLASRVEAPAEKEEPKVTEVDDDLPFN